MIFNFFHDIFMKTQSHAKWKIQAISDNYNEKQKWMCFLGKTCVQKLQKNEKKNFLGNFCNTNCLFFEINKRLEEKDFSHNLDNTNIGVTQAKRFLLQEHLSKIWGQNQGQKLPKNVKDSFCSFCQSFQEMNQVNNQKQRLVICFKKILL